MSLVTIDTTKCMKDHICVAVCPLGLIEKGTGTPRSIAGSEELCVSCGHCVSACPTAALSHRTMRPEQCTQIKVELSIKAEEADQFLRGRRSIRTYKTDPVDRPKLERMIRTASAAPSGHNTQPVEWLVIHDSSRMKALTAHVIDWMRFTIEQQPDLAEALFLQHFVDNWNNGIDRVCRSAPHAVLAHAHKDNIMATSACTIALAYLELAAHANGLGACWAGYLDLAARYWPSLQNELGLPADHISYGAMVIGYPMYKYYRIPIRKEARISWK